MFLEVWRQKKTVVLVLNGTTIDILNSWRHDILQAHG